MANPNDLGGELAPDDLVGHSQNDPIIAALIAGGYPVQPSAPLQSPNQPGVQPLVPVPVQPQEGPITSPSQVPPEPAAPPPTTPATAPPQTAYVPPPAPPLGKPLASGDVRGATAAQNSALETATGNILDTEMAKTDALAAHANARAGIYEGHATAQGLIDEQYQRAREKARMDANAETAAWMRDLDKKVAEEPVPGRWWHSQSSFGKVMYLMSLAFGAMAQAKNPQLKNIALEMITKETEADILEQRDRLKRQVDAMKMKGQVIDQKLQAKIADTRDDHALLVSRLAMVQQAALERANAPGTADQKAAMAEAAQWAGQQRLVIAGERANRAYAERDAQLGRDAEMARAFLTDKRDRDIAAANIQKDYDLARLSASVKLEGREAEKFKDTAVLHPGITGLRVVDATTGKPIATPVSPTGGLVYNTKREGIDKELTQDAEMAQDRYATLQRVSRALSADEDLKVLLKRNPQLVADLQKLGYQQARENDPRGIVTDKDLTSGMESALGGDLNSLAGRVASGTFSAGQTKLKEVVDKAIRDMPAKMSNKFGARVDASIPGYEGNVRVDWTPRAVEIDEPGAPTTQQTDATYGIKTPVVAPKTIGDLENAQALEKKGVQALPPYKPGSQDKVLKALEDFKGAMPGTIINRAGAVEAKLNEAGDDRAALEVQQGQYEAVKKANERLTEVTSVLRAWANLPKEGSAVHRRYLERGEEKALGHPFTSPPEPGEVRTVKPAGVAELAKYHGLTQLTGQDVLDIIERAGLKPAAAKE
jgi:hypothetical protein